jgi:hypothetical protein
MKAQPLGTAIVARGGRSLKNPLDSLTGTIVSGVVLTIILYFVVKALAPVTTGG